MAVFVYFFNKCCIFLGDGIKSMVWKRLKSKFCWAVTAASVEYESEFGAFSAFLINGWKMMWKLNPKKEINNY